MAKSTAQKIKVGIFVVVGTVLLVGTLYYIGKRQNIFGNNIQLHAVFKNVNGLQIGNNVRYSGINIGTINEIEMTKIGSITIQMSVDKKTAEFIKKDAIASIGSDGLVGSMVLNITPGEDQHAKVVVSGDYIQSHNGVSTEEMMNTLNKTNENAALLSEDLLKITHQILKGEGTIGLLISDTEMAQNVKLTIAKLTQNMEAMKHNFLFRGYFKKESKQKQKEDRKK